MGIKHSLYIVGAVFEFGGIMLSVSPDLVPGAQKLSAWLEPRWRPLDNRIRRLFRVPPRTHFAEVALTGAIGTAAVVSAVVTIDPAATLEAQVAFLLRRDREQQEALSGLAGRLEKVEREFGAGDDALREHVERRLSQTLDLAAAEHRAIRVVGALCLAVGLGLATAGNFVS